MIIVVQNIPWLADALRDHDEVLSVPYTEISNELLLRNECTALFVRTTTKVYKELLHNTRVRFVGTATSGVDHLDLQYLNEHGICYASAAGSNANAVAEYAVYCTLLYMLKSKKNYGSLCLGIVGYGHVGTLVATYAQSLGIRVLINDPPLEHSGFTLPRSFGDFVPLETILHESDVVSNHIPLVKTGHYPTTSLFNHEALSLLKNGAHFIHTSRGGIVDETALLQAMNERNVSASIDVWSNEPEYNLALSRRTDTATPHVSGHSDDGILVAAERLLKEYEDFSGHLYNHDIIRRHKSDGRRTIHSFDSAQSIVNALAPTLRIDELTSQLRTPPNETSATLREYFMKLRMAYKGRPEILTP